ncbi:MoaD/ThiS family protein [Methylomonas paludis]|uniref:Molybdopterin synthase sulfur carrier subunit n=1 Tax=Methylomonas paludis TaxID=1173101 RepID=A0A975MM40_9GAMM|nr:MoaD/ThiS family protein [Methylomonas paludis]QWF70317.1 MoaD/ThiS family protein [Methylomonas paludis]
MSIHVRYFASLKETVGQTDTTLELLAPLSARQIWQQLNPQLPIPETVLSAVNMQYVELDSLVQDGDELAFFPPVTGG